MLIILMLSSSKIRKFNAYIPYYWKVHKKEDKETWFLESESKHEYVVIQSDGQRYR